jgi:hypothetical protein
MRENAIAVFDRLPEARQAAAKARRGTRGTRP